MNDERIFINPNTADKEELVKLSGVGHELAQRIIEGRPYQRIEDLQRVNGIGSAMIEELRPYLDLPIGAEAAEKQAEPEVAAGAESEMELPAEIAQPQVEEEVSKAASIGEEDQSAAEGELVAEVREETLPVEAEAEAPPSQEVPAAELLLEDSAVEAEAHPAEAEVPAGEISPLSVLLVEKPEQAKEETPGAEEDIKAPQQVPAGVAPAAPPTGDQPASITRSQLYWTALVSSLVTLFLAVVITLGVLSTVNGNNLQFASPAQVNEISARAGALEVSVETLAGVRKRVDNLDALSGRVSTLEESLAGLTSSMDAMTNLVQELDAQVNELTGQMEQVMAQSERFQSFFSGLRELVDQVFIPEEVGK